ncbi:MAG: hypothetical protein G01um1014106_29 [Parcubacteria group bacterium Gr01-1014_106]|nr:MAG: hypothetical protein G01um1014106_29 [Parcubacteria group bacterium Gr01-1014_106]
MVMKAFPAAFDTFSHPTSGGTPLIFSHLEVKNRHMIDEVMPPVLPLKDPKDRSEKVRAASAITCLKAPRGT